MSSPGEYSFKGAALAKSERESAALAAAAHSPTAATNESDQVSIAARCNDFLAVVQFSSSTTISGD